MMPVPVSVTPCAASAVLVCTRVDPTAPNTFVNVKDVDVAVAGVHVYVKTVPVDPVNEPIVPLEAPVNAIVGRVVELRKVAVIVFAYPQHPLPEIVTPCVTAVLVVIREPEVTAPTFVNVKDVDPPVVGVQLNVNTVPVLPASVSIVPLDVDVNASVGSIVDSVNVAVIADAYPVSPVPVIVTACAISPVFD